MLCVKIRIQQYYFVGLLKKHWSEHFRKHGIKTDYSSGICRSVKLILFITALMHYIRPMYSRKVKIIMIDTFSKLAHLSDRLTHNF